MTKTRPQNWMDEEIAEGQLPDKRLDKRLRQVFRPIGRRRGPDHSLNLSGLGEYQGRLLIFLQRSGNVSMTAESGPRIVA